MSETPENVMKNRWLRKAVSDRLHSSKTILQILEAGAAIFTLLATPNRREQLTARRGMAVLAGLAITIALDRKRQKIEGEIAVLDEQSN